MTLLDQPQGAAAPVMPFVGERGLSGGHERSQQGDMNVGPSERAVSVLAGAVLAGFGLARTSLPGLLIAGVGGALIYRGTTGYCHLYGALGLDTAKSSGPQTIAEQDEEISERGIHVEQAFMINRSADELYAFWRDFENLPQFMRYLQGVRVIDEKRSEWTAKAPAIVGGSISWEAEVTADEPGRRIAWRSLPGSRVDTVGEIRFSKAMGDRGTEVHVSMDYVPPAGQLGHFLAKIFGQSPRRQMREDLRRFKQLMELGEIPTLDGQPHGTCAGRGARYEDSMAKKA